MGNEGVIVAVLGILLGLVIGYILFCKLNIMSKLTKSKVQEIVNNPRKLKELLEKNGTFVDDGKEISYKIEVEDGKEILVKETKEIQISKQKKETEQKKQTKTTKKPKKPKKNK